MRYGVSKKLLIITERKTSIYQKVAAIVFVLGSIFFVGQFLYSLYQVGLENTTNQFLMRSMCLFIVGIILSFNRTLYIDAEKGKLKIEFSFFGSNFNYYKQLPKLEYISVFKNNYSDFFEVNLWYVGNKYYKMYEFEEKQIAFKLAIQVADKLKLNLLDATEKGNFKWIDRQ